MQSKLKLSLVVSVLSVCASAQDFQELGLGGLADYSGSDWRAVALGDIDGDGHLDQVLACYGAVGVGHRNYWQKGDGTGLFDRMPDSALQLTPSLSRCVVLGDFDADGDLDAFFGNQLADTICRNNGNGQLVLASGDLPTVISETFAAAAGDLDGDGDLDIVCGCGGFDTIYWNDGTGHFTNTTLPGAWDQTVDVDLHDHDGDGDLDLVLANLDAPSRVLRNDGAGTFTNVMTLASAVMITSGDVDGDADRDLVLVTYGSDPFVGSYYGAVQCLNNGAGLFGSAPLGLLANPFVFQSLQLVDVDVDGDPDLAVSGGSVWLNDGIGVYSAGPIQGWLGRFFGDIDADGDPDQLGEPTLRNDGLGNFQMQTAFPGEYEWHTAGFADMDADGDLDLVGQSDFDLVILENDGSGKFHDRLHQQYLGSCCGPWLVADINADGYPDLVEVGENRMFENTAGTSFAEIPLPTVATWRHVIDADGDGDLDLLGWRFDGTTAWSAYQSGAFGPATNLPIAPFTVILAIADMDGDGREDLIYQEPGLPGTLGWVRCTGNGVFTPMPNTFPVAATSIVSVCAADFDGDGDVDVAAGHYVQVPGPQLLVFANDGLGQFTTAAGLLTQPQSGTARALHAADFDGDGDIDLLSGGIGWGVGHASRLFVNEGAFSFSEVTGTGEQWRGLNTEPGTNRYEIGDFDLDGDVDIASVWSDRVSIASNLQRQLIARGDPVIGTNWQLQITQRPVGGSVGAVLVGLNELSPAVTTPFGELRVDPLTATFSSIVPVATWEPVNVWSLSIPNDPALQGLAIFAQHVAFDGVAVTLGGQVTGIVE